MNSLTFDLYQIESKIKAGCNSGNFMYQSCISFPHKSEIRDCRMEVRLQGYSTRDTCLKVGSTYAVGGRWIFCATAKTAEAPTLNFDQNFAFEIGLAANLNLGPDLRQFVVGFGQVQWRAEVANQELPHLHNNLVFIMNNANFDLSDKTHQAFDVCYTASGEGPLQHAFNLVQLRRELQVILVAVATGMGPPLSPPAHETQPHQAELRHFDPTKPVEPNSPVNTTDNVGSTPAPQNGESELQLTTGSKRKLVDAEL
ncbi:hypothetical protein PCANC_13146 [Puccinia coronata f. sp. avenae]|uniref:Uncharacterized protein n=1 Tax=Puccinia coronata f. sp. avenae TaxID=200324 RepID=A0A2N5UWM6_9BASI|nr:hypothetical protein PCANC_13146 [Puccinia coronata f. sp. avenae]